MRSDDEPRNEIDAKRAEMTGSSTPYSRVNRVRSIGEQPIPRRWDNQRHSLSLGAGAGRTVLLWADASVEPSRTGCAPALRSTRAASEKECELRFGW